MIDELAELLTVWVYPTESYIAFNDKKTLGLNPVKTKLRYDRMASLNKHEKHR